MLYCSLAEPKWNFQHQEQHTEFRDIHLEVWDHNSVRHDKFMGATCIQEKRLIVDDSGRWSFNGWLDLCSTSRKHRGKPIDCSKAQGQLYAEVKFQADE